MPKQRTLIQNISKKCVDLYVSYFWECHHKQTVLVELVHTLHQYQTLQKKFREIKIQFCKKLRNQN